MRMKVATCGLVLSILLLLPSLSFSFTGAGRHVELVPEGSGWIVGHGGATKPSVITGAPWQFIERFGGEWVQRRGGPVGHFRRIWGEGIPVDPSVHYDSLVALSAAESFWWQNAYLLPRGVFPADMKLRGNGESRGMRTVTHDQLHDNVPVIGSGAYLVFASGRMVMIGVRMFAVEPIETCPSVEIVEAASAATEYLKNRGIHAHAGSSRLVIMPLIGEDVVDYKLVFAVELSAPVGRWTAYVDAHEGQVFALRDERMFMSATVNLEHHDRNPGGSLIPGGASYLNITTTAGNETTDVDGVFTVTGTSVDLSGDLLGPYVRVDNQSGTDAVLSATGIGDSDSHLWTGDGSEEQQAQLDLYKFFVIIRNHVRNLEDNLPFLDEQYPVLPNHIDSDGDGNQDFCNAWSDGVSINFLMAGGYSSYQCNNTAMIADIVYHEYGHSVHMNAVFSSSGIGVFDSAVSEAFADTTSVVITNDSIIGPYFLTTGQGIRDLEPDKVWPDDVVEDEHQTGLILGGALWDLRKAMIIEYGEAQGRTYSDELLLQMMRFTGKMDTSFEAALLSDDDNGDLSDGTPNLCMIYEHFALHGLAADGQGLISIDHEQIAEINFPSNPITVNASARVTEEECATLGEVIVAYSVNHGETWSEVEMVSQGGDDFSGDIPAQPRGTELWYRIEASDTDTGHTMVKPTNKAEPYYMAYVGPLKMILCDDFEQEDLEWTHELISGEDIDGADDWMRGFPPGIGGDPDEAYSGDYVWGNDLQPEDNWNGQYQPNKVNTLRSPVWDLSEYEGMNVRLRFRRWLGVEDGFFDQATVYVNETEKVWTNVASSSMDEDKSIHHVDKEWILFDMDISDLAAGNSAVQLRWEIASDQGLQFAGWNIDDVCLYTDGELIDPDSGLPDAGLVDSGVQFHALSSKCGCEVPGNSGDFGSILRTILAVI